MWKTTLKGLLAHKLRLALTAIAIVLGVTFITGTFILTDTLHYILSIFGAIIGIVIGTGLGVALVSSLRSQGITDTVVPVTNLVIFLVLAVVLGLIAASWPARRAAKLDVLGAIAAQ